METDEVYQLRVCDLVTDRQLGLIDLHDVSYDDYIGRTGSLSGTVPIPTQRAAQQARDVLIPGRTMLYLERHTTFSTEIAWAGVLWAITPTADERGLYTCPIVAAGLESWLRGHRMLTDTLTWAGGDQLAIARALVAYAQGVPGGDLRIEMDPTQLSGVARDRTYAATDLPWIGGLLDQLGAVEGGFEWRIQVYRGGDGVRHRALRLGYPILTAGTGDVLLTSPGAVRGHALPMDATMMATAWQSRGASINTNQAADSVPLLSDLLVSTDDIAAGWPRLDGSSDYSTVSEPDTLTSHARADLARYRAPVAIPSITVLSSAAGQLQLGSYIRLKIAAGDLWYSEGLSARYRIVGLRVQPAERGRPTTTDLYLEAA
ncbi:hypothetical protein ACIQF6_14735 [Kitasatospora sp. NPDC092948]|uniref:hypothetical protein n=1 Tax=Kitasatospora sp. NPDC092948 TaxID=3364088 RepID=UPI00381C36A7